jgi:hypothetical protein
MHRAIRQGFHRNLLFEQLYASLPRDPQVKVQIYNAEIVPGCGRVHEHGCAVRLRLAPDIAAGRKVRAVGGLC